MTKPSTTQAPTPRPTTQAPTPRPTTQAPTPLRTRSMRNANARQRGARGAAVLPSKLKKLPSNQRGVALVEAAIVIPVMLVFLGLIMFTDRSYEAKLDKQQGTRAGSLYYASHNCEGDLPDGIAPAVKDTGDSGPDVPKGAATDPNRLGSSGPGAAAGLDRSWNLVHAQPPDSQVYGSAVQDRQRIFFNRTIHAESEVACNEKPFPNKWTAIIQFIGAFARSGGGLGS